MSDVFAALRASVLELEGVLGDGDPNRLVSERILSERTARIAREPVRVERAADTLTCLIIERCGRRYAIPLPSLRDVGPLGAIAHVPGIPSAFLGVTARRGRVVSVVDLPRLFGSREPEAAPPRWLVITASSAVVCGIAADELHDVVDSSREAMAGAMPTFPPLVQRHTLGVLEDATVVVDIVGLVEDRALRVEERG